MSRKLLLFIPILFWCAGISARGLEEIRRSGKIYVAFTRADLKNINYDLALEFSRYLNVEMIEVEIEWEEAFMRNGSIPEGMVTDPSLSYTPDALKKADIICSTFTVMEWRKKLFGFARTLKSAELLMVPEGTRIPGGLHGLSGKKIAFLGATSFEEHLNKINESTGADIKLVPTRSSMETQKLIQEGKVFGIVLDADEALNFNVSSGRKYKIAFPISDVSRTAWAVEKNNPLIQEVESFFETIASNGILDEFFYQRFGITYSTYLDRLSKSLRLDRYQRDLDEILDSQKIVVALRDHNFIYHEGGMKEFMHALAEEFADYLGVKFEFVVTPYFGKYWETGDGMIIRDSSFTPDWFNYFDLACDMMAPLDCYTNKVIMVPVYTSTYAVVARKSTLINSLEDLRQLTGVTGKETLYEEILNENNISNYYYERVVNFVREVAAGKADYTLIDTAFYDLDAHSELEIKLAPGQIDVSWALRNDQPELEKELRTFIESSRRNGLIRIFLKALNAKSPLSGIPVCYIDKMYVNGELAELKEEQSFSHHENNVIFETSALSFSDEASVEYEYYMNGTGNKYPSYHHGRDFRASYHNLPPGKYAFICKVRGKNNIWSYEEKYEFSIRRAWYNTWVFRIAVFLIFLGTVYYLHIISVRAVKARLKEEG